MTENRKFIDIHSHIIFGADDGAESLDKDSVCAKFAHTAGDGKTYQVDYGKPYEPRQHGDCDTLIEP